MAVVTPATLKSYFERGDKPTEAQFIDLVDTIFDQSTPGGGGGIDTRASISASTAIFYVRYAGDAPTATKETIPTLFRLTEADAGQIKGFHFIGNNDDLESGSLQIVLKSGTGGWLLYHTPRIINKNNDQIMNDSDLTSLGIAITVVNSAVEELTYTFTNMSAFGAAGYVVTFGSF